MKLDFDVPKKLIPFIQSRAPYQVLYGGRSSGKTATALRKLLVRALEKPIKILCTREYQSSIATSTYAELRDLIYQYDLSPTLFNVKSDSIIAHNGSEFIFKGLARDIMQIKSIPDIAVCLVEEAETIGERLWEVLDPTLRKKGSELIILFNPRERNSATYHKWIIDESYRDDEILRIEINYPDNPFNSDTILRKIERMREHDYPKYEHIYLGKVIDMTEDVIFKNRFKVNELNIQMFNNKPYHDGKYLTVHYGGDFGFSVDPVAIVEIYQIDSRTIYINREIYQTQLLPSKYIEAIKQEMPEALINKAKFFWDSARPDSIAQLQHDGLNCEGAPKPKGSVESGIEYLQGLNIIVNPACKNVIYELQNYKYKTDKLTGEISTDIIDANNHAIDAIRYALWKQIQTVQKSFVFTEADIAALERM